MSDKHLSSQFDSELSSVSSLVMEMGGLVETQIRAAISALANLNTDFSEEVAQLEVKVNAFEIEIDNEYMMSPKDLCT